MTSSSKKIMLSKSEDWKTWLSFVRMKATSLEIWDLIDPELAVKPETIKKPTEPTFDLGDDPKKFNKEGYEFFKAKREMYKMTLSQYKEQTEAFSSIISFIQESITAQNAVLIEHVEPQPYEILRELKRTLAPTDRARELELQIRYRKLAKGPKNQNLEAWINEWSLMYVEAKASNLAEAQGNRPVTDFLMAIMERHEAYASVQLSNIDIDPTPRSMIQIIEGYRQYVRLKAVAAIGKKGGEHSAFAAGRSQSENSSSSATYRGKRQFTPTCLCGVKHFYPDCSYYNPEKRPVNWVEKPEVRQKITDSLKNSEVLERVNKALARWKAEKASSSSSTAPASSTTTAPSVALAKGIFATTFKVLATKSSIRELIILDSGADIHVCNEAMKQHYTKDREADPSDRVMAGGEEMAIESYGTLNVDVDTPTGPGFIILANVAYVSNFLTTVASMDLFKAKGVYFDNSVPHLHQKGKTMFQIYSVGGHYTFKPQGHRQQTQPQQHSQAHAIVKKTRTANEWHSIMAHPSHDSVMHLEQATSDVVISDLSTAQIPKTNECETCALTKSHVKVSRNSDKSESSDKPFHRVTFDLMQFSTALNGDQWCSHLACSSTNFNLTYTHRHKSDARAILRQAFALIRRRFNGDVVFLRVDGETSLDLDFLDDLKEVGITYEASAPYTPAQNGHAERMGGVLAMKARALRIEASLPGYLWNEAIRTAGYIANRTPMRKHDWKTPFEAVTHMEPQLFHLKAYGCKAYAHKHNLPKKLKLDERAHIGHLVGYDSTNIFRIWVPSKRKIIRTRDVIFDEDKGKSYDPTEPDLYQLVTEPMIETTFEIPQHFRDVISSIEADDDDVSITDWNASENVILPTTETANEALPKASNSINEGPMFDATNPVLPTPDNTPTPDHDQPDQPMEPSSEGPGGTASPSSSKAKGKSSKAKGKKTTKAKQDISADFDEGNIIPEGVTRNRKKKYAAAIQAIEAIEAYAKDPTILSSFHDAFSAFSAALKYYDSSFGRPAKPMLTAPSKIHRDSLPPEPLNYRELAKHPYFEQFKMAMRVEIEALRSKGTWDEVPRGEADRPPIPTTWVYKYKFDEQGYLIKFKARLCARGDLQKTDEDTYAATLAARIFRALMAIVAAFDLETRQYDAVNAFANSPINELTYCSPPQGWEGDINILLKLLRALYGLKQSPALWYRHLSRTLIQLGLDQTPGVECCFTNDYMIVFFFVDDICLLYDKKFTKEVDEFQSKLFEAYEMRNLGQMEWFLGIRIIRDRPSRRLWLCQDSYIDKIANKFNITIESSKTYDMPLPNEVIKKHTGQANAQEIYAYQQRVGSINFPAVITRPDVAQAASKLAEHLTNPSPRHAELAERVLIYLTQTKSLAIEFDGLSIQSKVVYLAKSDSDDIDNQSRITFLASSDASFADDFNTRYSSQGYIFTLFNGPIDWKANKQKTVTLSSTEAELLALSTTGKETMWWTRFFDAISFDPGHKTFIQCDNRQTIRAFTSESARFTTKLRHVDIHNHWMKQEYSKGTFDIHWTPTTTILADGLTKPLSGQRHKEFIRLIGMKDLKKIEDK